MPPTDFFPLQRPIKESGTKMYLGVHKPNPYHKVRLQWLKIVERLNHLC